MSDPELRKLRKLINQYLPAGSAHMSEADVAGIGQLIGFAGNPTAGASLIKEIDRLLNADPENDHFLTGGGIGARFDTPGEARAYLRELRAFFTGESTDPRK